MTHNPDFGIDLPMDGSIITTSSTAIKTFAFREYVPGGLEAGTGSKGTWMEMDEEGCWSNVSLGFEPNMLEDFDVLNIEEPDH